MVSGKFNCFFFMFHEFSLFITFFLLSFFVVGFFHFNILVLLGSSLFFFGFSVFSLVSLSRPLGFLVFSSFSFVFNEFSIFSRIFLFYLF